MRYLFVVGLAAAISAGCWSMQEIVMGNDTGANTDTDGDADTDADTDGDTDTDTGPDCTLGEIGGYVTIETQSDIASLAGYTSIAGGLVVHCPSCTDLS